MKVPSFQSILSLNSTVTSNQLFVHVDFFNYLLPYCFSDTYSRFQIASKFSSVSSTSNILRNGNIKSNVPASILPSFNLATANQQQITMRKIFDTIQPFKLHDADTGSSGVQSSYYFLYFIKISLSFIYWLCAVGILTERILNLARHSTKHRKDINTIRRYQVIKLLLPLICGNKVLFIIQVSPSYLSL